MEKKALPWFGLTLALTLVVGALACLRDAPRLLALLALLNAGALAALYGAVRREARARRAAEEALAGRNRLLEAQGDALARASRRFEALFQGVPAACFCYDARGRLTEWNQAFTELFELADRPVQGRTVWDVLDMPAWNDVNLRLVQSVFAGESFEGLEWEHRRADGQVRSILCSTFPLRDADGGAVVGGITIDVDITGLKSTENALRDSEERFQTFMDNSPAVAFIKDEAGRYVYMNRPFERAFGLARDEGLGRTVFDLFPVDVARALHADNLQVLAADRVCELVETVPLHDGRPRQWLTYKFPFRHGQEGERLLGSVAIDVTEQKQAEEALRRANARFEALAMQDGMTGLQNHRAFRERLDAEVARARRDGSELSLLLLDVDRFKQFNDRHGHPAGDEALRQVAGVLRGHARASDLAARYGGEEFVVILPRTDIAGATVLAERMRSAIEGAAWPRRAVTASFGASSLSLTTQDATHLVTEADVALYASKEAGRNCVTHYDALAAPMRRALAAV